MEDILSEEEKTTIENYLVSRRLSEKLGFHLGFGQTELSSTYIESIKEPTDEEAAAFMAALDEVESAANRALNQYERNLSHLRYARIELETARTIAATSNRTAASLAGATQ